MMRAMLEKIIVTVGVIGALIAIYVFFAPYISRILASLINIELEQARSTVRIGSLLLGLLVLVGVWLLDIREAMRRVKECLQERLPEMLAIILVFVLLGTWGTYQIKNIVSMRKELPISAGYWERELWRAGDDPNFQGRIKVWGAEEENLYAWGESKLSRSTEYIFFNYSIAVGGEEIPGDNAGGYILFYEPRDLSEYRYLLVTVKVAGKNPDLGIRLALDDTERELYPRERITREISSLQGTGLPVGDSWTELRINLANFKIRKLIRPLPETATSGHFNKLVFFVDNAIVNKSPKGTVYVKDAFLEK